MTVLKLAVAALCFLWFILRLRDARKLPPGALRTSKTMFALAFLACGTAIALDANPVYDSLDALMGGHNYANLVTRAAIYSTFFLLGTIIARAFDSMLALWLVQGIPGIIALAIAAGVSVAAHLMGAYGSNPYGSPLGWVYVLTWQLYMVYIALALLTALLPVTFTPGRPIVQRTSAAITGVGLTLVISYPTARTGQELFHYPETYADFFKIASICCVIIGTGITWAAVKLRKRRSIRDRVRAAP